MQEWEVRYIDVKKKASTLVDFVGAFFQKDTGNFYESSYGCPYCNDWLYKTVFPWGGEYTIRVKNVTRNVGLKRVFTCAKCRVFFSAANDLLSDGVVYELKCTSDNDYNRNFIDMNQRGTKEGRLD